MADRKDEPKLLEDLSRAIKREAFFREYLTSQRFDDSLSEFFARKAPECFHDDDASEMFVGYLRSAVPTVTEKMLGDLLNEVVVARSALAKLAPVRGGKHAR